MNELIIVVRDFLSTSEAVWLLLLKNAERHPYVIMPKKSKNTFNTQTNAIAEAERSKEKKE